MSASAGVRFPPPFIYAIALLVGIFADRLLPSTLPRSVWIDVVAAAIFVAGFALAGSAIARFRARGTAVLPSRPSSALVVDGPYRFTRNPMYGGLTLVYLAIALWTASLWACLLLVAVLFIVRYAVIAREERYLTTKFGADYVAFTKHVRRWL